MCAVIIRPFKQLSPSSRFVCFQFHGTLRHVPFADGPRSAHSNKATRHDESLTNERPPFVSNSNDAVAPRRSLVCCLLMITNANACYLSELIVFTATRRLSADLHLSAHLHFGAREKAGEGAVVPRRHLGLVFVWGLVKLSLDASISLTWPVPSKKGSKKVEKESKKFLKTDRFQAPRPRITLKMLFEIKTLKSPSVEFDLVPLSSIRTRKNATIKFK